jgi:hypothetical protein
MFHLDVCHLLRSFGREASALVVDVLLLRKGLEASLPMFPQLSAPHSPTGAPFVMDLSRRIVPGQLIVKTNDVNPVSSDGDPSRCRRE